MSNLMNDTIEAMKAGIEERVASVRCPAHGKQPEKIRVTMDPQTGKGGFDAEYCCAQLEQLARSAF